MPSSTNSSEKSQDDSNKSDPKINISAKQAQEMKASVANPDAWGRLIGA